MTSNLTRFTLAMLAIPYLLFSSASAGAYPAWWTNRGVITGASTNDYSAANQGQVKHVASKARDELEAKLPGGAGATISNVIANFSLTNANYNVVTVGQLKNLAKPFYDRLVQVGYTNGPNYTNTYPWSASAADDYDYAVANIGQVKHIFSFNIDTDSDDLFDTLEYQYFGNLDQNGAADSDGDGLTNDQEFQNGSDPTDFYNGVLPVLSVVSGNNQSAQINQWFNQPLVIQVTTNSVALTNAPIIFSVLQGGGQFGASTNGTPASTLSLRSDINGLVSSYFQSPPTVGTNLIKAVAASGTNSVQVSFKAISVVFSIPSDGLVMWLKGDAGVTTNGSGNVSVWADQSGSGNNASQAGSAAQPLWVSDGLASGPAVRFDGSDDILEFVGMDTPDFTVFVTYRMTGRSGYGGPMSNRTSGKSGFQLVGEESSSSVFTPHLVKWNGSSETANRKTTAGASILPLGPQIQVWTSDLHFYRDGVEETITGVGVDGDTISIAAGVYSETNLVFRGKSLIFRPEGNVTIK